MSRHEEQKVFPFPPEFIFDIVADVKSYPEFLPWCVATRVYREKPADFLADVVIGFKIFRETWTSHIYLDKPDTIVVDYIKGPMRHLHNEWKFTPHAEGTLVDFILDFEFKNPILQKLVGALFEEAVHHMVSAFEKRVQDLSEKQKS